MRATALMLLGILGAGCSSSDEPEAARAMGDAASEPPAETEASLEAGVVEEAEADAPGTPAMDAVAPPLVNVLTQHNDIRRTGANLQEQILDTTSVSGGTFGKVFARAVDDQIYGQPLIVTGVDIPGQGKHDVVYVATVNDTLYAFDADDPALGDPLWKVSFLGPGVVPPSNADMVGPTAEMSACNGGYTDFSGNIGVVGTPVIDDASRTIYLVARTKENGGYVQRLYALDLATGVERANSPVTIDASVPGTGENGDTIRFDPLHENQRAALLLLNGVVYVTWGGHCDWLPYHGWLLGYDKASLDQVVVYNTTPNGLAGGLWQSGQGPSSDGTDLYVITGNGTVGVKGDLTSPINRGESYLRLARSGSTLQIVTWFTPYNFQDLELGDLDLGSAGLLLVPGTHLGVSGGKGGHLFVVDTDDMGGLTTSTTTDDNIIQGFDVVDPFEHIHGSPVFWEGPSGARVYVWGEDDSLRAYPFLGANYTPGSTVLDADNVEISVVSAPRGMAGQRLMPGAMLSISANGSAPGTGIVWATHQLSGDANQAIRPGILRAIDASDVHHELWNSASPQDDCGNFAKFSYPTVANGKVYLASFANQLCVYGLKSN